jgi:5-methyltetrahydropteroyltriglutamate--homocysteine methyltransferase
MTASRKIAPPFRADQVGSLLRPAELAAAHRALRDHSLTPEQFAIIQDRAIRDVIAMQEGIGLRSITDGEFRRASYWSHFVDAIDGMTVCAASFLFHNETEQQKFTAPKTTGKLRRARSASTEEYKFLASVTKRTPKITMPSPPTMHFWVGRPGVDAAAYPDDDLFFADLARIYRQEIGDLAAAGARYIQLDDVPLVMLCDPSVREAVRARGEDPERLIAQYIRLINESIKEAPADITVAMHCCRGNYKGRWLSEGGYDYIAERLFNQVNVDAFFLEYDTPRAGDFGPLAFVPPNKTVVLGLVSSKTPQLESADVLKRRVAEAGRHVSIDQLGISAQCGFASTVGGNPLTIEDEKRKLELLVRVAGEVWA